MDVPEWLWAAGLVLAAPSFSSLAQPVPAAPQVTLAQVLEAARANPDVSLARRALASAQADIASADHAPAPVLTAKASSIDLQNGIGGGNVVRDKRIDKSLGIDWTWERGNKRELRTRAARRGADAAQLDLQDTLTQQQVAAAGAFYDLLAAQERVAQVEAIERTADQLATASQRRQKAGDLSQQEQLRTEIEARRARAELRSAQADQRRAGLALAQLTGMAADARAEPAWPPLTDAPLQLPDVEVRPDVRAARQRAEAAQAAFDGALALRKNDVTLGTSLDHYPGTSNRLLEVRLSVPLSGLFGAYGYQGEIAKARAALDQAQDQLEKVRRAALTDNQRLLQDAQTASARARDYEADILPRARQVASMAELAYGKGALSLTELIDARRTLRSALLDHVAARAEHARAFTAWQLRSAATDHRP